MTLHRTFSEELISVKRVDGANDDCQPDNKRYSDKMNDMMSAQWNVGIVRDCASSSFGLSSYCHFSKMLLILPLTFCLCELINGQELLELKYRLEEEQRAGTYVGNVFDDANLGRIYGFDALQQLQFRFLRTQQLFVIDNATGVILTNSQIDREAICPSAAICDIRIDVVLQPQPYFRIIRASVTVLDVNDNWPQFEEDEQVVEVPESASVGTILLVVSATDPDSPELSIREYQLKSSFDRFQLSAMSRRPDGSSDSKLMLTKSLDRELTEVYHLQIIAVDGGYPPNTGSMDVIIRVLDVNDNIPKFEQENYTVAVMENVSKQTTVLRLFAVDGDVGLNGEVVYGLSLPSMAAYGDLFGVDNSTGDLYIKGDLDFERISSYLLTVVARDRGTDSTPVTASVTILVGDANDNAPEILVSTLSQMQGTAEVHENCPLESFVAHFTVSDKDSGDNGRFECRLNDTHFKITEVYSTEYQILTAAPIDRENRSIYNLTLTCVDFGDNPQESIQPLTILVLDVNDNDPVFSQNEYREELIENNYVGKILTTVNATDQDSGKNGEILYSLSGESADMFHINPDTGVITAAISFDREVAEMVRVEVLARDKGTPSRSSSTIVHITILDVNDEKPVFSHSGYSFSVMENLAPGANVGTVAAHDRDRSIYGEVTYAIHPTDGSDLFDINHKTGSISTTKMLDREAVSTYYLTVIASDREVPPLSSTASVTIYISDENDNAPVFDYPAQMNNTISISNRTPKGHVITRLRAHDLDVGPNGKITYDVTYETKTDLFNLDMELGTVFVNRDITDMDGKQFLLEFIARDEGAVPKMAFARLNVIVNRSVSLPMNRSAKPIIPSSTLTVLLVAIISSIVIIILVISIVVVYHKGREKQTHKYNCRTETLKMFSKPAKQSESDCSDYSGAAEPGNTTDDKIRKEQSTPLEAHEISNEKSHLGVENPYMLQKPPSSSLSLGSNSKLCVNGVSCQASAASKFARNDYQGSQTVPLLQANKECEVNHPVRVINPNDADSVHSGEGSNADSGHGPSEEGESTANSGRPFVLTDLHSNSVQVGYTEIPTYESTTSYNRQASTGCQSDNNAGQLATGTTNPCATNYPCSHSYSSQSPLSSFSTFSPRHLHNQVPVHNARVAQKYNCPNFACRDFVQRTPSPHHLPNGGGYMTSPVCRGSSPHGKVSSAYSVRSLGRHDDRGFINDGTMTPNTLEGRNDEWIERQGTQDGDRSYNIGRSGTRPSSRRRWVNDSSMDSDCTGMQYSCADVSAALNDMNTPGFRPTCRDINTTVDSGSGIIDPYDLCDQIDDIFFRDKMTVNFSRPR